jgi:hypothetical protein
MLFKLQASKDVFELNPQLKAIEEFERLTSRQMAYVMLSTDYKSPFRKLSSDEKRYQAAVAAGYKFQEGTTRLDTNGKNLVAGKVGTVAAAITKYNEIQKDEDYETLLSVSLLISQIRELNNKTDKTVKELETAVNLNVGKLDKLIETKKRLEEILDMRDEEEIDPSLNQQGDDGTINVDDLPLLSQLNDSQFNTQK